MQMCVTATALGKTFNLAGLQVSNIVIKNEELRRRFQKAIAATGFSGPNAAGLLACKTAYQYGEEWYEVVKKYIQSNIDEIQDCLSM